MDSWLAPPAAGAFAGPAGGGVTPLLLASLGLVVLVVVAAVALAVAPRLPAPLRRLAPRRLRPRLTLALALAAAVPALVIALVLASRSAEQRLAGMEAALLAEASAAGAALGAGPRAAPLAPDALPAGFLVVDARGAAPTGGDVGRAALAALPAVDGPFAFDVAGGGRHLAASAPAGPGRRVVRYAPVAPLQAALARDLGSAAGWLIGALIACTLLAVSVADHTVAPLSALDRAVREIDPELERAPARAPPGAPREVVVVFEHLAGLALRLRDSVRRLQDSVDQGERLRRELVHVIETREQEIEGRTQQLKIANEDLDRLSRLDALTGVANRRGLAEQLDRAWRSALRDQQPLSVLMIDIDSFKAYNDTYGHPQGDSCIRAVADAIRHVAGRATDFVARYGGEEFVVVLGGTALEGALQVGEQVRTAVEGMNVPHLAAPGRAVVTVSVGVTSVVPTRGARAETALLAADRALYAAKEQGRNRVGYSSTGQVATLQASFIPNDPAGRPPS